MRTPIVVAFLVSFLVACGPRTSSTETHEESSSGDDHAGASGRAGPVRDGDLAIGSDACTTDADCAPADCCHPAECVARASAPSCADTMCTMECRAETMDCGGGCLCHQGHCAARLVNIAVPAPE